METSASTWPSMKWLRSFWTKGRRLSDLEFVHTKLALVMPAVRSNPSCAKEEVNKQLTELTFFQLVIAALGALNPARPFYMLRVPLWGSVRKKRYMCV